MEKEAAITQITTTTQIMNTTTNNNNVNIENKNNGKKIKKRGTFQMLKVALFMLRRGSNKKSKTVQAEIASKGIWKKLVGAMRPLHHQELPNQNSPPPSITTGDLTSSTTDTIVNPNNNNVVVMENSLIHDDDDIIITPQMLSPNIQYHHHHSHSPSSSSSSVADSMSRYASAQDLQELDKNCDDDEYFYGGDQFIDAKAEEFIAQFYEQMRIQQLDLMNRYNEKKMKKKLAMEEGN